MVQLESGKDLPLKGTNSEDAAPVLQTVTATATISLHKPHFQKQTIVTKFEHLLALNILTK